MNSLATATTKIRTALRGVAAVSALSALSFSALTAQDVTGSMTFPSPTHALYTIDIQGQPGEAAMLFVSTSMAPGDGIVLPGLGTLHISPFPLVQLTKVMLDSTGAARLQFPLSLSTIRSVQVLAQVVFANPRTGQARLSTDFVALGHQVPSTDFGPFVGAVYYKNKNNLGRLGIIIWGDKGDKIKIERVRGGKVRTTNYYYITSPTGVSVASFPWYPKKGDRVKVYVNDVLVAVFVY